ncbi:transcriptional regulator [Chelativorans sp. YIM 93263]|uniref:transcriptional regulator n=1 Tax=Chelativorans sp. YIM 93263 TaxID=2906648 RepID=UPI002379EACD|nr:transcriptional regulator [Chelativorans sp. YIM 93263]
MATDNAHQEQVEQERRKKSALVEEYRKVGPAAINAALLCSRKKKEKARKPSYEPHDEI